MLLLMQFRRLLTFFAYKGTLLVYGQLVVYMYLKVFLYQAALQPAGTQHVLVHAPYVDDFAFLFVEHNECVLCPTVQVTLKGGTCIWYWWLLVILYHLWTCWESALFPSFQLTHEIVSTGPRVNPWCATDLPPTRLCAIGHNLVDSASFQSSFLCTYLTHTL